MRYDKCAYDLMDILAFGLRGAKNVQGCDIHI